MNLILSGKSTAHFIEKTGALISSYYGGCRSHHSYIQEVWKNIWKPEAEVEQLIRETITFENPFSDPKLTRLFHQIYPVFIDIVKSPYGNEFFIKLSSALRYENAILSIENGVYYHSFIENDIFSDRKKYVIKLCIEQDSAILCKDKSGDLYLDRSSVHRATFHELVHIFQYSTGQMSKLMAMPKTKRWGDCSEMMAIRGCLESHAKEKEYSENEYATKRGERERISYESVEGFFTLPKSAQLLVALNLGANGTVYQLLQERLQWRAVDQIAKKALLRPYEVSDLTAALISEAFLESLPYDEDAGNNQEIEDRNYVNEIGMLRKKALAQILDHLKIEGFKTMADQVLAIVNEQTVKQEKEKQAALVKVT